MNQKDLHRYRITLLKLRDRLTDAVLRMSEIVRTDAQPMGEHDRHVSESPDAELALEQDEENIRRLVVDALKRVENGTFGICQQCGTQIGLHRLDAVPYVPNCIKCERKLENVA
jgi:RNA polymerase-binding protein DksA